MWRKRKWIIVGVVVALVVVAAGITGGLAYAQTATPTPNNTPPVNPGKDLADRVATILGLDQAKVEAAFAQAEKDMQSDAVKGYLDKLVQAGKMTQSEADQYLQWWQAKPQTPQGLKLLPPAGGKVFGPRGFFPAFPGKGGVIKAPSPTPSAQ
jgi:hypothetical protein